MRSCPLYPPTLLKHFLPYFSFNFFTKKRQMSSYPPYFPTLLHNLVKYSTTIYYHTLLHNFTALTLERMAQGPYHPPLFSPTSSESHYYHCHQVCPDLGSGFRVFSFCFWCIRTHVRAHARTPHAARTRTLRSLARTHARAHTDHPTSHAHTYLPYPSHTRNLANRTHTKHAAESTNF